MDVSHLHTFLRINIKNFVPLKSERVGRRQLTKNVFENYQSQNFVCLFLLLSLYEIQLTNEIIGKVVLVLASCVFQMFLPCRPFLFPLLLCLLKE